MGISDLFQNLISGSGDLTQGSVGDMLGGITDNPMLQDLQDQAATLTDGATEAVNPLIEQAQTVFEDVSQNLRP